MTEALRNTAHHYHAIGEDFDRHTKEDMEPMLENLYSYKGTVQAMPDILSMHKVSRPSGLLGHPSLFLPPSLFSA